MPKVMGRPPDPSRFPYMEIMGDRDRESRLLQVMRKMKIYKRAEGIRYCIDYAYRELVEKDEK